MTPKEKAKDLVEFYRQYVHGDNKYSKVYASKLCSERLVNEILEENEMENYDASREYYWQEVKQEISNL